ncbi:hypothetical protein P7C70_g8266, partial [Phenoliferia sp. Uapishka_3]
SNPTLPVKAFPALTLATTGAISAGQEIELTYSGSDSAPAGTFAVFISGLGQYPVAYPTSGKVTVPADVTGQVYVVITSSNATVTDDATLAGPTIVEVPVQATTFSY